jgi:hypothetical protein
MIKLSTLIGQSQADIIKAINESVVSPFEDQSDDQYTTSNRQAVTAGQEYDFTTTGTPYSKQNLPSHITGLFNGASFTFSQVLDTPMYAARVQMNFAPSTAAEGYMEFKLYIFESTPVLIQTIRSYYKASDTRLEALFTFYVGSEVGYDIKGKGAYITYTPKHSGHVYDRGILIYKT